MGGSNDEGQFLPSRGCLCPGVYVQGVCRGGVSVRETLPYLKSGRYASYWNAFFFKVLEHIGPSLNDHLYPCFELSTQLLPAPTET